ncbi:nitrogenase cofactor biosynthesis protein NifB [Aliagarivorans marinus]|uniref:nitrogenase cofactor biosynthesis protein NifB n=1 Tax=Aliagarivorans marinus TaxID=561965 RepID=UPI000429E462|nr:nitrogenase cofactor biosynthesis protein NifB [Aliagarivorans marinus]
MSQSASQSACSASLPPPNMSAEQAALVEKHPCFSKGAHQFARMHLAVAPACNIQCNYCNRKFDCSNETRPGVSSSLLSPAAAVQRFAKVKQRIPETQVVGIAGPGDPLANPNATLATLKAVGQHDDEVHLCVSTNGLELEDQLPKLLEIGVKHLTITINCIDAAIGEQIYAWVYFNGRRLRGKHAAQTLIDRQLKGLKLAIEAGMLVKVNTVLIPGINDWHIAELAEELQRYGAFVHNVMPLISDPAHGTYFGLMGQRGPTDEELAQARSDAGVSMAQMTHCQQCRADAVGKLGEQVNVDEIPDVVPAELTVAVASRSGEYIDQHFGYAKSFDLYRIGKAGVEALPARDIEAYCRGQNECDEDEAQLRMSRALHTLEGVDVLLCSRIGLPPRQALQEAGISVNTELALKATPEALEQVRQQLLEKSAQGSCAKECG